MKDTYSDNGHVACAKLLIEAGANVDIHDRDGVTARSVIESKENLLLNKLIIPLMTEALKR